MASRVNSRHFFRGTVVFTQVQIIASALLLINSVPSRYPGMLKPRQMLPRFCVSSQSKSISHAQNMDPDTQWQLGMQNGILIAVPIPEEYEAAGEKIQLSVNQAVSESEQNGINKSGRDATPWLLNRIAELTHGESLTSNVALLKNTALIGE
jgi:pseudouridine-5'-phosphate glycosidase